MRRQLTLNGTDMTIVLEVLEHNKEGHLDVESQIGKQKDGLFTFIVRVADRKIVNIVFLYYESYEAFQEPGFSRNPGERG